MNHLHPFIWIFKRFGCPKWFWQKFCQKKFGQVEPFLSLVCSSLVLGYWGICFTTLAIFVNTIHCVNRKNVEIVKKMHFYKTMHPLKKKVMFFGSRWRGHSALLWQRKQKKRRSRDFWNISFFCLFYLIFCCHGTFLFCGPLLQF